ncbi:MAG: TonB-dependent receptor [Sulfurifustis sp.]
MTRAKRLSGTALAAASLVMVGTARAEQPAAPRDAPTVEAPTVEVVGTTPLPVLGTPIEQVPANVQAATGADITQQHAIDLSDFLYNNTGNVTVNAAQNNPFQPNINFRGFVASPLLGNPQGLSVFQDGVRINEPFGDVVNWDLVPPSAISSVNLIPGSNPVFGLNTLGGALSINTKSGFQYPGVRAEAYGGSFGRNAGDFEIGGHGQRADYFVTANYFDDDGWATHNPSRVKQLFAKTGYEHGDTDFDVSATFADNRLEGQQTLPLSFFDDRRQAYTFPDINENTLGFLNARLSHFLTPQHLLAANIYYRRYQNNNLSSNINDQFDPTQPIGPGNTQAINDASTIETDGYGGSVQWTALGDLGRYKNQFTLGASADLGDTDFTLASQEANFTAERRAVPAGDFVEDVDVAAKNRYYGLYATDTLSLTPSLHLTLSGRYNTAQVELRDQTGLDPALNGTHRFSRFNPAMGITFMPGSNVNLYAGYNEGTRVPTPVELTCADPAAPCKLPNAFLADPSLEQVVSKTWEAGARSRAARDWQWNASVFRTDLHDDIQFVSSGGAINAGFFRNVGVTRRQGLELGLRRKMGALTLDARYGYVAATFESPFTINSPNNSTADASGDIQVRPGDRIPGIPAHTFKLRAEYAAAERFLIGGNLIVASNQFARGDENNGDVRGPVPGYAIVNLDAHYRVVSDWTVFLKVNNLFDKKYETAGLLGENFFNGPGQTFDATAVTSEQFRSVAAPRGIWVGVRYAPGKQEAARAPAGDRD